MEQEQQERWSGWAVAMTSANLERRAVIGAASYGITTWVPEYADERGRARILFRNYVLALVADNNWKLLFRVKEITLVLRMVASERPALINPSLLETMRAQQDEHGLIRLPESGRVNQLPKQRFKIGAAVPIKRGAFQDQIGIYQGMSEGGRERVLFSLLGREVVAELDYDAIAA